MRKDKYLHIEFKETKFWKQSWIAATGLAVLGAARILTIPQFLGGLLGILTEKIGEALLIAGLLALLVDPFLKKELLHSVSKGLFVHMLGFDLEPTIKRKLAEITFKTDIYLREKTIHCRLSLLPDKPGDVTTTWFVRNPSDVTVTYEYGLAFERAENIQAASINYVGPNGERGGFNKQLPPLDPAEPGVRKLKGYVDLHRISGDWIFTNDYTLILPEDFYHDFATGTPLINTTVNVSDLPAGLEIHATPGFLGRRESGPPWRYEKLFMPGDRVALRWFPKSSGS